MFKNPHHS